jgi:3-phosphoshikimate 1-carboxyvinyltransferase
MLEQAGKPVHNDKYHTFTIDPSRFVRKELLKLNVEGDWSGSANLLVGGAISGGITIGNLNLASRQADIAVLSVLKQAGATFTELADGISIRAGRLNGFSFDATHCPDLFPILSVLAAYCDGESHIKGVHRLFGKESNRVESIAEMLQQFGVHYSFGEDELSIYGEEHLNAATIDSYNDHRIVMAAAIGALKASGPVTINNSSVVAKSYPGFFNDLNLAGIAVTEESNFAE